MEGSSLRHVSSLHFDYSRQTAICSQKKNLNDIGILKSASVFTAILIPTSCEIILLIVLMGKDCRVQLNSPV